MRPMTTEEINFSRNKYEMKMKLDSIHLEESPFLGHVIDMGKNRFDDLSERKY